RMKIPRFVGLAVFVFAGTAAAQPSTLYGSKAFENFGLAVAAGGDLDSDGFLDVLVGFPGDVLGSATVAIPCGVRGYSGQSGAMILKVDHPDPSDWFGHAICSIGDVDQDGHDDVA